MDQPAYAEKQNLKMVRGSVEVLESSLAFLRPGIATGIDSLRRPLLSVSWAASTVFRYVTLADPGTTTVRSSNGLGQNDGQIISPRQKPLWRRRTTKLKFRTRLYQSR
jgi:hypothetical protein